MDKRHTEEDNNFFQKMADLGYEHSTSKKIKKLAVTKYYRLQINKWLEGTYIGQQKTWQKPEGCRH